jgi:hypothetical protein
MPFKWQNNGYTHGVPRQQNQVPTETFTISTTPHVVRELERLVATGHFGKTAAEAAERIVAAYLHEHFAQSSLESAKPLRSAKRTQI